MLLLIRELINVIYGITQYVFFDSLAKGPPGFLTNFKSGEVIILQHYIIWEKNLFDLKLIDAIGT